MTRPDRSIDADLASHSFLVDPYPTYRRLREEAPVHWSEDQGFWLLSRYDDVLGALRDGGEHYSLSGAVAARFESLSPADQADLRPIKDHYGVGLLHSNPPEHTRLRALVSKAFTPRVIEGLRPRIHEIVDELLRALGEQESPDLVRDFTFPLPAAVLCDVLGLPPSDTERFKAWSDDIALFIGSGATDLDQAHQAQASLIEARDYLTDLAEQRRQDPQDDVISRLANAARDDALTPGEFLSTCVTFLVGGHETTTALISSAALLLMHRPEQREILLNDPTVLPSLVEETIRYETPGQRATRRLATDVELGGQHLAKRQKVMLMLGAANRDSSQFTNGEAFDIRRDPNRHLGFGMGHHFCIGAPLARLEGQIALAELFSRFPTMQPVVEAPDWVGNFHHRQLKSLRVELTRAAVAGS
jgi:pimeloyl-[acyl-carrier protein] synthase